MLKHLSGDKAVKWLKYFKAAVDGGCDLRQAEGIANERSLRDVMKVDGAVIRKREERQANAIIKEKQKLKKSKRRKRLPEPPEATTAI